MVKKKKSKQRRSPMRTVVKKAAATKTSTRKTASAGVRGNNRTGAMPKSPKDIVRFMQQNKVRMVDLKFNDLPGLWQHFSLPAEELYDTESIHSIWKDGIGFDGSSIRGFQKIQESDMILHLDPTTAIIDPACQIPTLSMICDIYDPITREPYTRDPRYVAEKAANYLRESKIADTSYWGPEAEFFLFNDVRFAQNANSAFYSVDSNEGVWNTGRDERPNLGYKPRSKEGYFPVPPHDSLQDIRSEIVLTLRASGVPCEVHHHEV
jgi:glutamine synthetase